MKHLASQWLSFHHSRSQQRAAATTSEMVVEWSPWGADGSSEAKLIKQAEHGAEESTCRDLPRTVFFGMTLKVKSDDYKRPKATFS